MPEPDAVEHDIPRLHQPDDVSCGPTCLTQVLWHHGDARGFETIAARVARNPDGGTVGVHLGRAALALGYGATLYSYNLRVFDPTWASLDADGLRAKLAARADRVADPRLATIVDAYREFLDEGGVVRFAELGTELLVEALAAGHPIICGLSATHLYRTARDDPRTNEPDDVGGEPAGHFVVVGGYLDRGDRFVVFDPWARHPLGDELRYEVAARRLLNSILLGDVTYDGVLLIVSP